MYILIISVFKRHTVIAGTLFGSEVWRILRTLLQVVHHI